MGKLWKEEYEAKYNTRFQYNDDRRGGVVILAPSGESCHVQLSDLVEFVEVAYHGSEIENGET